jgi:hypothetical protein
MTQSLVLNNESVNALAVSRPPEQILAEAKNAADVLMRVYNSKPEKDKVKMNGNYYLEFEDWNTLARFFNVTPKTKSTEFVTYGSVQGFEAFAEAVTVIDGVSVVLTSADAMCLNDEENWGPRAKYEWQDVLDDKGNKIWEDNPKKPGSKRPKAQRIKVGEEPTPLFQLRSMAQTRAQAKCLRQLFSWVIVLAELKGIATTPAEEMGGSTIEQEGEAKPEVQQPKQSQPTGTPISDGQRKRMYAIARDAGFNAEERVKQVIGAFGFEKDTFVTKDKYSEISTALTDKNWTGPKPAPAEQKTEQKPSSVEGRVDDVREGKDSHGPFLCLDMGGVELYAREPGMFEVLKGAKGKDCAFMATVVNKEKMRGKIVSILRVGDKEWMEDGTPVIRVDRGTEITDKDAPPAQGVPLDFNAK